MVELHIGIKINYVEQKYPRGIPEAFAIGKKFINNDSVALILGDNFFYGQDLSRKLKDCINLKSGAKINERWRTSDTIEKVAIDEITVTYLFSDNINKDAFPPEVVVS